MANDTTSPEAGSGNEPSLNFIEAIIEDDMKTGKFDGRVHTRFPPEPNGYLHIGHAKAICIDFGMAKKYGGKCNLRFDDTNPVKEDTEYIDCIQEDVKWLGFDWEDRLFHASDYFDQMYEWALDLIRKGHAYVDEQTVEEIREARGTLTEPGTNGPYRDRPIEESLDLFVRMKDGEFQDGAKVLRAKIDMAHPNMNLRDPIMYRIVHADHPHVGDKWCIYPMYDWAHGLEDSIEGITHSLCSLEFENHRPLYDWYIEKLGIHHPQQIEFARFNLTYTVMSKRLFRELVEEGLVDGWDDPRMPLLGGLRRRGFDPAAIREFMQRIGVAKVAGTIQIELFEHILRDHLNRKSPRAMAVLNPLKVVIENYPEDQVEEMEAINNPEDESAGIRKVPFSRELYIEREDFMEDPPKKFFRLAPGREVRLRYAYFITCTEVIKDDNGEVVELRCTYDPDTKGGNSPDGRKVKATLHWVSAKHAVDAEVRLYDRLFMKEDPMDVADGEDWKAGLNPDSLTIVNGAKLEPSLGEAKLEDRFQFERLGYFCVDSKMSKPGALVFNRTVTLKDTWAKIQKKGNTPKQKKANNQNRGNADGANVVELIDIDQFFRAQLLTAKVTAAEKVEGADRLLKLQIEVGDETRQIIGGIARWYKPEDIIGKNVVVVANLKPATIFGVESQGMLLAAKKGKKKLTLLTTDDPDFATGAKVG